MAKPFTATAVDIFNAMQKRLQTQGHALTDNELLTLTVDVMNTINTDAANAVSHAATEITKNLVRPFLIGV